MLGYLSGYGAEEGLSSGHGILWLRLLALIGPLPGWAGKLYLAMAGIGLALLALHIARLALPDAPGARALALGRGSLALAGAVMAAMTPHYAWYLCWLPWLACLYPSRGVFCLTTLAAFLYWDPGQDRVALADPGVPTCGPVGAARREEPHSDEPDHPSAGRRRAAGHPVGPGAATSSR